MQLASYKGSIEEYKQAILEALAPRPQQRVYQWMEDNCSVRGEYEGRYKSTLTPFVREPLDCFADRRVEDLTLCWATQIAKTTTVMGGVAYRLVNEPGESLWVMPDKDFGGSFSRQKWQPFVEDCGPLNLMKPAAGQARSKFFTTMEQQFGRSVLYFVGSNSATQVAGRSCGLVVMDETDKFGKRTDREAGALANAEERAKTFNYPLIVKTSTPTTKYGEIWQSFLLGDQRYFYVPCPHCREMITLNWKQMRWWRKDDSEAKTNGEWDMAKIRANTHYRCQANDCEIHDSQKVAMIRDGEWRATVFTNAANRRSYHLNSLYAPWKKTRWPELAVKFIESKANLDHRQKFINSTLAELWSVDQGYDDDPIPTSPYLPADLQRKPGTPILSIDVQSGTSHFWVVVRNWAPTGESWLLHAGRLDGGEGDIEVLQARYGVENNNVLFDIAHMTNTICQWMVRHDWRGTWGSDSSSFAHKLNNGLSVMKDISPVKLRDPWTGTAMASQANPMARYVQWAHEPIKDQLALLRYSEPSVWHVHGDAPPEYFRHLNAEKKIATRNKRTGQVKQEWHTFSNQDHLKDCECIQIVGAHLAGIIQEEHAIFAGQQQVLRIHDMTQKK